MQINAPSARLFRFFHICAVRCVLRMNLASSSSSICFAVGKMGGDDVTVAADDGPGDDAGGRLVSRAVVAG